MTRPPRAARQLAIALWALIGLWAGSAWSQSPVVAASDTPAPRVVQLHGQLEADRILEVHVDGLTAWSLKPGHAPWRLVPYLDGRALAGLYPIAVDLRNATLQFHLRITPDNRSTWDHLLSPLTFGRPVRFSVGLEQQDPFETRFTLEGGQAVLTVLNPRWMALAAFVVLMFAGAFCALAVRTPLLMERVVCAQGLPALRFSLAKVQLALWFFVVFGAFLVIWLATGNFDTINSAIVATLGISAGTAVGDAYIKSARPLATQPLTEPIPMPGWVLGRFFGELVSDGEGYSIYRFQMLAWTVALVVVFLADVYDDLDMPSFGPELLYLLGLSSGTFVAHRMPEVLRDHARADSVTPPSPAAGPWPDSTAAAPPVPHAAPAASPWGRTS